jgi:hypothetical protein
MIGHRPSSLPSAQYCAQSALLGAEHGSGRAAAISTAWHARCSGATTAEELFARLTTEEQAKVLSWPTPVDVLTDGILLSYSTAVHEFKVGLDGWGEYAHPDDEKCLTGGTLDFAWRRDDVAYVADLKKSRFTCVDGPDSLQLQCYGWAFATFHGLSSYITGLWIAESAEWQWSHKAVVLDSPEGEAILDRIIAAAKNGVGEEKPPFCTGPHCLSCYARTFCPEHTLSAAATETWLAPLAQGVIPSPEVAADLWSRIGAAQDILEKAEAQLKAWVQRGELTITAPDGKILAPVEVKGRKSLDKKALEEAFGDLSKYEKQGAPFNQWRWLKPKGAGK